ncbi:MAG: poly-gamma-glutamate system protein [Candidatus Cloacimonadia bacterium]
MILLILATGLFSWSEGNRVFIRQKYYEEKLAAARLMQQAEQIIKEYRLGQGIYIDELNDPNRTALIGERYTLITTDRGSLNSKLTTLNPNFAAIMVDLFKKAGVKKGDVVAVNWTGSMPALNIAVMSAAKVLGIELVIISSVGASMFGATDPDFTWLDMETLLYEKGVFSYKSMAASIGGGSDIGRGLSKTGRDLIIEAIKRNNVELVNEGSLEKNIQRKMELFKQNSKGEIKVYLNIGGGLSSLGSSFNANLLKPGLNRIVSTKNIPMKGTLFLFAEEGIPIIHLLYIQSIAEMYNIPIAPVPLPEPGTGSLFIEEQYNLIVTAISFVILIIAIAIVIFFDKSQERLKEREIISHSRVDNDD